MRRSAGSSWNGYCGHEIDHDGLHKTKAKIEAVQKAPHPQNVSGLRGFIGLVNYNHRLLSNLASSFWFGIKPDLVEQPFLQMCRLSYRHIFRKLYNIHK